MEIVEKTSQPKTAKLVQSAFESKLRNDFGIDFDKLQTAISILPQNYTFEVEKTICRIFEMRKTGSKVSKVSLQFPEGLLVFSTLIADIIN